MASRKRKSRSQETVSFINYTPAQANRDKGAISAHSQAADVYIDHLAISKQKKNEVMSLYKTGSITDNIYDQSASSQAEAINLLCELSLDAKGLKKVDCRWGERWSVSWGVGPGKKRRVLYQCGCGYDHIHAGSNRRSNPVDYTGCLGHVEIMYSGPQNHVVRVRGYLNHNDACTAACLVRIPAIPLHPSVYTEAVRQLKAGIGLSEIQDKNDEMISNKQYPEMNTVVGMASYRWKLEQKDTRSLYRQYHRVAGVNIKEQAHINIDEWLDPSSSKFNSTLAEAVFHYSARAAKSERFQVSIATKEMREAAWSYGHESQIILDGTFGLCDRKMLLFIVMGIDNERKGVPLAFIFFSAPGGCKRSAAGYNTEILTKLLTSWKDSLGERDGTSFNVYVVITDTDLKERGALVLVFPNVWLLICKFHLRQSWRNHRNKLLKGKTPTHTLLKSRMRSLEDRLIRTLTIEDAKAAIGAEVAVVQAMQASYREHASLLKRTLSHLKDYLLGYWTTDSLWRSWSDFGREVAAKILKCPFEGVLPTTNHLESFNGLLKRKHLKRWQRNGRRIRLDVLLHLLVSKILPAIFKYQREQRKAVTHWENIVRSLPGGQALLNERRAAAQAARATVATIAAYLQPDKARDAAAKELLQHGQIGTPSVTENNEGFVFTCFSSLAVDCEDDTTATAYVIYIARDATAHCTCPDFTRRGGACKHLRAALLQMDVLRNSGLALPVISLPTSPENALALQSSRVEGALEIARDNQPLPPSCVVDDIQEAAAAVEKVLEGAEEADSDNEPTEKDDDDDDDNESVATDASDSDSDSEENEWANIPESSEAGTSEMGWESTADSSSRRSSMNIDSIYDLPGTARRGIDEQAIARTFYELENMSPNIDILTTQLRMATKLHTQKDLDRAKSYIETMSALTSEMQRLLSSSGDVSDLAVDNEASVDLPQNHVVARSRPNPGGTRTIIAVSPEKAQKRKDSYGFH